VSLYGHVVFNRACVVVAAHAGARIIRTVSTLHSGLVTSGLKQGDRLSPGKKRIQAGSNPATHPAGLRHMDDDNNQEISPLQDVRNYDMELFWRM
jgi:hypothetical protein